MKNKKLLAFVIAALMLFSVLPVSFADKAPAPTPIVYDAADSSGLPVLRAGGAGGTGSCTVRR